MVPITLQTCTEQVTTACLQLVILVLSELFLAQFFGTPALEMEAASLLCQATYAQQHMTLWVTLRCH